MTVALITGTSSGIGLATAVHLAREGHEVYATMRDLSRAGDLEDAIASEQLPVTIVRLDVTDDESVKDAVGEVLGRAGRVDVVVNNAGISGGSSVAEELAVDTIREVMETNFYGAVRVAHAVLPQMRERGDGCIVNVSSVFGRFTHPSGSQYIASKWALEGWSEALAIQVARSGIRVAIIEPGATITSIGGRRPPQSREASPYLTEYGRAALVLGRCFREPSPASLVAETIGRAISTDEPRLRYLVGWDAELLAPARESVTDEQWVELWATEDQEAWFDGFERLIGLDVRPDGGSG